ncbi:MAG: hypothetical protein QOH61_1450 [Chloroflexota bacterium]|nr:hypothetical protein [Chloroflexota bacterium]
MTEARQSKPAHRPQEPGPSGGHIVLCGLESLGVRTLEELDRLGERVVIVARNVDPRYRDVAQGFAALHRIVEGDPRDADCLREAEVQSAKAIVLTEVDDVANIHAALTAQHLNPTIHTVIRTYDEEFGRRVETLLPDAVTLSASAIAGPGFVSAILDEEAEERWLEVLGRTLVLRHTDPRDPAVLAALADDSVDPVVLFPQAGESLLCLVDAAGEPGTRPPARAVARPRPRRRPGVTRHLGRVDTRFWVLGGVLLVITAVSAVIFAAASGLNPLEAVYDVIGAFFGGVDPSVANSDALRVFAILLTLVGAAALAAFYGLIADVVLSTRISHLLGPRAADAHDHVIVVGLGTIGFRIASLLHERGIPVVAAERAADGRFVEAARAMRIPVLTTDARSQHMLKALSIETARALVATTDDDAANLATALHARALRPDLRVVLRLFDPDLAARLDRALGKYNSRSVSSLSAPAFAAAAVGREVLATIPVSHRRVLIVARVPVEAGSAADGSTIAAEEAAASAMHLGGCRILAVAAAGQARWRPAPDERVAAGTELVVVATKRGLATALKRGGTAASGGRSGLELAHHQEVGEPEGVQPGSLGGVQAPA